MINLTVTTLLTIVLVLVLLPSETYAFGAGEIPEFAYLHDKAFRHGDIENILAELAKTAAGAAASGGSLFGFAHALFSAASGGAKFSHEDVKKVYFGNWLRDYSQAMDIAGLSKLSGDTIVLIVSVLGFVTFGFATEEYEVTKDRLGVYLPVEHIDNPKGYAEKEGDARQFDPRLRPPVNPQELQIDPRTGMKNYMATENRGWDTSTAHIRRIFRACIDHGRRAQGRESADLWEAYRLLGTGLHTMEDLLAHSNWCELALRKMGHEHVFCHVGDSVIINTPNGPAPPLITGTFGSADFLHSLMGEATDHLSQASVIDLTQSLTNAAQSDTDSSLIRTLLKKLPIGGSSDESKVSQADDMKAEAKAYQFNPDDMLPPRVQEQMFQLLKWRDDIYRDILKQIEMIPGLESLINALSDALNAFVYTILAPYLTPVLQQVTSVLTEGSKAILDSDHTEQFAVFDDPNASDPSHSLLSKDHFALILNEPAGKTALVVVKYAVKLMVDAWFDQSQNPDHVIDQILEAFHHPYYNTGRSRIQQEMFDEMESWFTGLGPEEGERVVDALTKESVREGRNKRQGSDSDMTSSGQVYGQVPAHSSTYRTDESYAEAVESAPGQTEPPRQQTQQGYQSYSRRPETDNYGYPAGQHQTSEYETTTYSASTRRYDEESDSSYGYRSQPPPHHSQTPPTRAYGEGDSTYDRQPNADVTTYRRRRDEIESTGSGYVQSAYGGHSERRQQQQQQQHHHSHRQRGDENEESVTSGYNPSYESYTEPSGGRQYGGGSQSEYGRQSQGQQTLEGNDYYGNAAAYRHPVSGSRRGQYGVEPSYEAQEEVQRPERTHGEDESYYDRRNVNQAPYASGEYGSEYGSVQAPRRRDDGSYGGQGYNAGGYYSQQGQEFGGQEYGGRGGDMYAASEAPRRRYQQEEQQSYEPAATGGGYGGGYGDSQEYEQRESAGWVGGNDDTFGAERLNINNYEVEERPAHHGHGHHHKKHHHQQEE